MDSPRALATDGSARSSNIAELVSAIERYRTARLAFLNVLGVAISNRDPLAEFSERLVAALPGGSVADSRTQKGYDVVAPQGERIQVKFLANP
jgi:hypothetical protein